PDQTDARSKIRLLGVPHGVGNSRVAFEEQSSRGIRIDFAELTGMKGVRVETGSASIFIRVREHWLPAHTVIECESLGDAEGVLGIEAPDPRAQIVGSGVRLRKIEI